MKSADHYDVLEIQQSASTAEIKAAFRRLAQLHHPDKNLHSADATARFQALNNSYRTLVDPVKRRQYDLTIRSAGPSTHRRAPPEAKSFYRHEPPPQPSAPQPGSSFHQENNQRQERDDNDQSRKRRITELGVSLGQLHQHKSDLDHDLWARERLLATIRTGLDNLDDQGDSKEAAAVKTTKGALQAKFVPSWLKGGKAARDQRAAEERRTAAMAERAVLQGQLDEVSAAIATLRSRDQLLMAQIMDEMRELARLNIEQGKS